MRLIDADALADALFEKRKNYPQWVAETIGNMPDDIVRCTDCKWRGTNACFCKAKDDVQGDWFCSEGEKRTG